MEFTRIRGTYLALQIEPRQEDHGIAGHLRDGDGVEHRFTGWLGLLTLLEQARLKAAPDAGDSTRGANR